MPLSRTFRPDLAGVLLLALASRAPAQDDVLVGLLQLPSTRPLVELSTAGQLDGLASLVDGDPSTVAVFPVSDGEPVDLVFDLAGPMAPERLTLRLSPENADRPPARLDLLVSVTSPTGGFRSLKSETIAGLEPEVTFPVTPAAARWLMIRLFPPAGAESVALADLGVWGHEGPPRSRYEFGESPATAIEIVRGLAGLDIGVFSLTPEEGALFDRARTGRLDGDGFERAALLASGVRDPDRLEHYIHALDKLEAEARSALDLGLEPAALGASLLQWLHARSFGGGYREAQTDLSVLLDTGVFNCVSSAVLYTALGLRLGLDVRGIEVPDHAFAIVYDGVDHMDVETTTAAGFDPRRDRVAEFEALTGFTYIPDSNRDKRREIGGAGLAALIYYNHGVALLAEGRHQEAVLANFRAMSLDPEFASAATNALAAMSLWSADLSRRGQWEEALQVAAAGIRLAPEDAGLSAQRVAVWQDWAQTLASEGRAEEAVALLGRAAAETPDAGFEAMQAWVYLGPGEGLAGTGEWAAALEATAPGLAVLKGAALDDLQLWRRGLHLRWINSLVSAGDHPGAAEVLAVALSAYPEDEAIRKTAAYLAQEWARSAADYPTGISALATANARFPGIGELDEVAAAYVARTIEGARPAASLADSLRMVEEAAGVLTAGALADLGARAYELHGHGLIDVADWQAAAEVYSAGLARFPESGILKQNARFVIQEWQRSAYVNGGPAGLEAANTRLAALFPQFGAATGDGEVARRVSDLLTAGDFVGARETIQSAQFILTPDAFEDLFALVVDRHASAAMETGDMRAAATAFGEGLARFPDNRTLSNNANYVAQEWMRQADAEGGAEAVLTVRAELVALYHGDSDVAGIALAALDRSIRARIEAGDFAGARGVIAAAKPHLTADETTGLAVNLYNRWGLAEIEAGRWDAAAAVYSEGLGVVPGAGDLERNSAYVVQEWCSDALRAGGAERFVEVARAARAQFPELNSLDRVLESVLGQAVQELVDAGEAEEAIALAGAATDPVLAATSVKLMEYAYDQWARRVGEAGDWSEALRIYDLGLTDVPNSAILRNNRDYANSRIP